MTATLRQHVTTVSPDLARLVRASFGLAARTDRRMSARLSRIPQVRVGTSQIRTPRGGGGCPLSGAPVKLYGDPLDWEMRVLPCEDFIELVTESGRTGIFSYPDRRYCQRGLIAVSEMVIGDLMLTEDGEERLISAEKRHLPAATVDSYEASRGHIYSAWGFVGHNLKYSLENL